MLDDELHTVRLRNDFYRDGFHKIIIALVILGSALGLLLATSVFLILKKPSPVVFATDNDWRIFPPVPVTEPYLNQANLLQWVSEQIPKTLTYDFTNYADEIKSIQQYFTADGWAKMTDVLKEYANTDNIVSARIFLKATPIGAPYILNSGLVDGKYSWWIQMPLTLGYMNSLRTNLVDVTVQALIVRVSTLDNLTGIAIDNVIVTKTQGAKGQADGKATP